MARSRARVSGAPPAKGPSPQAEAAKPLGVSNRETGMGQRKLSPAHKERRAQPGPLPAATAPASRQPSPPLPAAADALLLPGLDDDGPPQADCQLPLPDGGSANASCFGNCFAAADTLRVTSLARSAAARRVSTLRLVVQPDAKEGQRLSRLAPEERPVSRARTVPLHRKPRAARSAADSSPPSSSTSPLAAPPLGAEDASDRSVSSPRPASEASCGGGAAAPAGFSATSALAPPLPLPIALGSAASMPADQDGEQQQGGQVQAESSSEGSVAAQGEPAADAAGAVAEAAASEAGCPVQEGEAAEASPAKASGTRYGPPHTAVYSGVPAEVEAAALPCTPPTPAWLQQQGSCRNEPGMRVDQAPARMMHSQHAAAQWRCMWLSGLQSHNASRVGHPIRTGSAWPFIPLDPNEPLLEMFMFQTAVMPEHVIAGAARFQDILLGDQQLHAAAVECGVFSWGVWGVPTPAGGFSPVEGGRPMPLPVTLRCAPPQTVALFLACVWHEANRAESCGHVTYTFGANGERIADERSLKYSLDELSHWVCMAVGGTQQGTEDLLATLAHLSCFGVE